MKYYVKIWVTLFTVLTAFSLKAGNEFCNTSNTAFKDGEVVIMRVYYSTLGMFIGAGDASFTTTLEKFNGKPVYHCVGEGKTFSFFDNFFKVRDRYETYIDTTTMLPMKFIRNVSEGGYKTYNNVTFDRNARTAITTKGVFQVSDCIQDVVSATYYARNINYNNYKPGDKIPFDMFLDDEVYHLYLRYVGKETIKTRYGKFRSIKLKPLLIKGALFQGGEKMNAWISDDPNHLLLRIESPISVGSIKVDMMGYKNLRYRLTSLINIR